MGETLDRQDWVRRVLGANVQAPTAPPNGKQVRFAPVPTEIKPPPQGVPIGRGRPRSNAITSRPPPLQTPGTYSDGGGRSLTIAKLPGGGVSFTAPPPPVREITFSGGGGKGAALPGAVRALEESGVLQGATKIAGASVGSMTAAIVAAGITADEFTTVANAQATTDQITEGSGGTKLGLLMSAMKNTGNPLTGQGLESVVRDVLDETLRKRITEYIEGCGGGGKQPDPSVLGVLKELSGNKAGPTFGHLRTLSKSIPAIKEVVITGTYTTEFEENDKGKQKKVKDGNQEGQLYVFDADSEPDLEVAVAVHASASFPAAFKPVDIKLSTGMTVRFIDGGVMNNTPTSSSIGNERALDPMPDQRGMTFVFEDKEGTSAGLLQGKVAPSQGFKAAAVDWFVGSQHNASEYAKNRDMADKPEEIVVVPLQLELPPKKAGGKPQTYDMRDGTLEFNLPLDAKIGFQEETRKATNAQIAREKGSKTREFASDSQMFVSITLADLTTLEKSGYPGAREAHEFREKVAEMIGKLKQAVIDENKKDDARIARVLEDKTAKMALDELNTLAGGDVDFQGYVGREMNKGGLDTLLDAARKAGVSSDVMAATFAVSDALKAHTYADNILKQLVYPKMRTENEGGAGIATLLSVESMLRAAKTPEEVNEAIDVAVDHFKKKSDKRIPKRGHKKFAQEMARRKMKPAA